MRTEVGRASVGVYSFRNADVFPVPNFEWDLNSFRDPMGNRGLRKDCKDGRDEKVRVWIKEDPRMPGILAECRMLVRDRLDHGKYRWISIGFKDYHGIWISRAVAEIVADDLAKDYEVAVVHCTPV